ncbi:hypothetical protein [Neorickettsia findlayensis]|uniref:Uncharacterized protein n=1 Tax=Neorickettsia findlayensis TaxID=2686014 RepID=A0A6P1GA37_9RICK|nr:hypothetical protein [Neorickettsia findlayensis]QHD65182.1 hypothetical protein GP480_01780 [Neorickettsia findlayensis]
MLPHKKDGLEMQDTQQGEQPQEQEGAQSNASTQQGVPDSQQQGEQPQEQGDAQSNASTQQGVPDSQQQGEQPQEQGDAQSNASTQQGVPDSQQQGEQPQEQGDAQSNASTQQGVPDSQQQGEQPQEQGDAQSNASTQQGVPDSQQQGEQPQGTRKKLLKRWSQTLTASSSALKKKAKASIKRVTQKLDQILPGESTEELQLRLLKAEEAKTLKEEVQPGMELANMYASEISDAFGLRNVDVTSSNGDEENGDEGGIIVKAHYLDGTADFLSHLNDPGKPKPEEISTDSITFGTLRAVHEWLAAARASNPWTTEILARTIMNVTGATPSVIPVSSSTFEGNTIAGFSVETTSIVQGATASSVVQKNKHEKTGPQLTYKIGNLTQSQIEDLRAFCASLTSIVDPRLRIPYQKIEVEGNDNGTFLVLRHFPGGQSACFPFIQEICALSLECTPYFKAANNLLKTIIEQTTDLPLSSTLAPQFKVLFDLTSRQCFLQCPTELLQGTWSRTLVHYLCSSLKATAALVDTIPPESQRCARNETVYGDPSYHKICKSATEGKGSMAICMPHPERLLPRLVEVLQEALERYQCSDECCKLTPGAVTQPHLGSFCSVSIGTDSTYIVSVAIMVLNAETVGVLPAQTIFTRGCHITEGQSSCIIASDKLVKVTEEGLRSVVRAATRFPIIQENVRSVTEAIMAALPLTAKDTDPLSILTPSQTTLQMKEDSPPVAAVKLSWGEEFIGTGCKPKLQKPAQIAGTLCFDSGIVLPLSVLTEKSETVKALVEEIRCELKVTVEEKVPEPDSSQSLSSKPVAKKDAPEDKTAVEQCEAGVLQRFSRNVSSFFARSRGKSPAAPKKTEQALSERMKNMFIAVATAVVLAAIIYLLIPLIPRFENMPVALQAVGSILTGALISCIAYTCVTKIQSGSR